MKSPKSEDLKCVFMLNRLLSPSPKMCVTPHRDPATPLWRGRRGAEDVDRPLHHPSTKEPARQRYPLQTPLSHASGSSTSSPNVPFSHHCPHLCCAQGWPSPPQGLESNPKAGAVEHLWPRGPRRKVSCDSDVLFPSLFFQAQREIGRRAFPLLTLQGFL